MSFKQFPILQSSLANLVYPMCSGQQVYWPVLTTTRGNVHWFNIWDIWYAGLPNAEFVSRNPVFMQLIYQYSKIFCIYELVAFTHKPFKKTKNWIKNGEWFKLATSKGIFFCFDSVLWLSYNFHDLSTQTFLDFLR